MSIIHMAYFDELIAFNQNLWTIQMHLFHKFNQTVIEMKFTFCTHVSIKAEGGSLNILPKKKCITEIRVHFWLLCAISKEYQKIQLLNIS